MGNALWILKKIYSFLDIPMIFSLLQINDDLPSSITTKSKETRHKTSFHKLTELRDFDIWEKSHKRMSLTCCYGLFSMFSLVFMPIDNLEENLIWEVNYSTRLIFILTSESKLYTLQNKII